MNININSTGYDTYHFLKKFLQEIDEEEVPTQEFVQGGPTDDAPTEQEELGKKIKVTKWKKKAVQQVK